MTDLDYLPVPPTVELSYRLHPDVWGQGLGTEAAGAALDFGFAALPVWSLAASIVPGNVASHRVALKLGMRPTVDYPYTSPVSGKSDRFLVYRISRGEWVAARATAGAP